MSAAEQARYAAQAARGAADSATAAASGADQTANDYAAQARDAADRAQSYAKSSDFERRKLHAQQRRRMVIRPICDKVDSIVSGITIRSTCTTCGNLPASILSGEQNCRMFCGNELCETYSVAARYTKDMLLQCKHP